MDDRRFECYQIRDCDFQSLFFSIDQVVQSGMICDLVLNMIRFVTFDSLCYYIVTRGEHVSTDRFEVRELPTTSHTGFRLFQIEHDGSIGTDKWDYKTACSWLLAAEIETTAVGECTFPNENFFCQPDLDQPEEILWVVNISCLTPFRWIHKNRYAHMTSVVFHEAAHIQHRMLRDWRHSDTSQYFVFPSVDQYYLFYRLLECSATLPVKALFMIRDHAPIKTINELYAMLIQYEAEKRYVPRLYKKKRTDYHALLKELEDIACSEEKQAEFLERIADKYFAAHLLVCLLEDLLPDFRVRIAFMDSCLRRED